MSDLFSDPDAAWAALLIVTAQRASPDPTVLENVTLPAPAVNPSVRSDPSSDNVSENKMSPPTAPPPVLNNTLSVNVVPRVKVIVPPAVVTSPAVLNNPVSVPPNVTAPAPLAVMLPADDTVVVPAESSVTLPVLVPIVLFNAIVAPPPVASMSTLPVPALRPSPIVTAPV